MRSREAYFNSWKNSGAIIDDSSNFISFSNFTIRIPNKDEEYTQLVGEIEFGKHSSIYTVSYEDGGSDFRYRGQYFGNEIVPAEGDYNRYEIEKNFTIYEDLISFRRKHTINRTDMNVREFFSILNKVFRHYL